MTTTQQSVIFDMDGTLIDPLVGIANSYRHMCVKMGIPEISDNEVRELIGPPIHDAMATFFKLEANQVKVAVDTYREYYRPHGVHQYTKYPGIDDLLMRLCEQGFAMHIATSKPRQFAEQIVHEAGWRDLFSIVGGAQLDGSLRHKGDVIAWVLRRLPQGSPTPIFVGDRPEDANGAHSNKLPFIGVNWGFSSAKELRAVGAEYVVTTAQQLQTTLCSMTVS